MKIPSRQPLSEQLFIGSCELDRMKKVIETVLSMTLGIASKIEGFEARKFSVPTQLSPSNYHWSIDVELKRETAGHSQIQLTLMNSNDVAQLRIWSGMDWRVENWSANTTLIVYEILDDLVLKLFEVIPNLKERCQIFMNQESRSV